MNTLALTPLVYMEMLADQNRKPSALLIDFESAEKNEFLPLVEHPDFRNLTGQFPCVVISIDAASPPPALTDILQEAGCQLISPNSIHRTNSVFNPSLPSGIEWVAGNWYLGPPTSFSGTQSVSRTLALQLVQLVMADADTHEIETVLRRDPALSYHLLRVVNSLGMGLSKTITSFSQAILILGRAQLRRWLNLMLFSSREGDDRSAMLLARVATRARAMELLAKAGGMDKSMQDLAFMAGMFSLLGVLFGLPLTDVLKPLKISEELHAALLHRDGELGRLLTLAETAERGDMATLAESLEEFQVAPADFNLLNVQAHTWTLDVIRDSR